MGDRLNLADLADQTHTFDVNLLGLARTVEVVLPGMLERGAGHLVGLSSLADAAASDAAAAYAASKAGMSRYLQGLALATRKHGVAVSTVRFGFVDTKMAKSPVKPAMLSVAQAVAVIERAIRTRRMVVSRPRRMAALMGFIRAGHVPTAAALKQPQEPALARIHLLPAAS